MSRHRIRLKDALVAPEVESFVGPDRFRWLVAFAQAVPGPMAAEAERRLIRTLAHCLQGVTLRREDREEVIELDHARGRVPTLPLRREENLKSVEEKLALIRGTVHSLLNRFLSSEAGEAGLQAVVTLRRTVDGEGLLRDVPEAYDLRDALAYVLLEDLAEFGRFLRRCAAPKCGRLLVRERRQRYCSRTCRNRTTFHVWYRRHKQAKRGQKPETTKKSVAKRHSRTP